MQAYGIDLIEQQSHPSRVRGLKSTLSPVLVALDQSHPSRVRGLKSDSALPWPAQTTSHPSRVRGLKCLDIHTLLI